MKNMKPSAGTYQELLKQKGKGLLEREDAKMLIPCKAVDLKITHEKDASNGNLYRRKGH